MDSDKTGRKRRHWSQETVDREIAERIKKGLSLTPSIMKDEDDMLMKQGAKYYGGWKQALIENNISPDDWYLRKPNGHWTKEDVDKGIFDHIEKGFGLAFSIMKDENYALYSAACKVYGSWKEALTKNGIDYDYWFRRDDDTWTEEKVIKEINRCIEQGVSLSPMEISKDSQYLYKQGLKHFGNWANAMSEAGVNYRDWQNRKPKGYWTEETIKKELLKRKREGKSLGHRDVGRDDSPLLSATIKKYGTWAKGLELIGEDINNHLTQRRDRKWSVQTVKQELLKRKSQGLSLTLRDIKKEDNGLYLNMKIHFNTREEAYEMIGEDPSKYMNYSNKRKSN